MLELPGQRVRTLLIDGWDAPLHYCIKNHEGMSGVNGGSSAQACLDMTVDLYDDKLCSISSICIDDDASTRSMMKWSNADWMKNNNTIELPQSAITRGPNKDKMQV
jgi:hypothetical protein